MQEYRGTHGNQRLSDMNTRSKAVQGSNQTREGLESPGFSRGEDVKIPLCPEHHAGALSIHKSPRQFENLFGSEVDLLALTIERINQ